MVWLMLIVMSSSAEPQNPTIKKHKLKTSWFNSTWVLTISDKTRYHRNEQCPRMTPPGSLAWWWSQILGQECQGMGQIFFRKSCKPRSLVDFQYTITYIYIYIYIYIYRHIHTYIFIYIQVNDININYGDLMVGVFGDPLLKPLLCAVVLLTRPTGPR